MVIYFFVHCSHYQKMCPTNIWLTICALFLHSWQISWLCIVIFKKIRRKICFLSLNVQSKWKQKKYQNKSFTGKSHFTDCGMQTFSSLYFSSFRIIFVVSGESIVHIHIFTCLSMLSPMNTVKLYIKTHQNKYIASIIWILYFEKP